MRYYEFFCPVKLLAGLSALDHLAFELNQLNVKRPLIITGQQVKSLGLADMVIESLQISGMTVYEFNDVSMDSSFTIVKQVADYYREFSCDAMIAIGGGSVIDTAKASNILVSENSDNLYLFAGANHLTRPLKPLIIIPTTSGTGSEVTNVAVIFDENSKTKVSFMSPYLLPNIALLDPRMTQSMPPKLTAMTAMDALTHAIESYIGLGKNPLSDAYATTAIRLISENLFDVINHPQNHEKRFALAQASTMAGIAFSNSMVGLVHSLGHATGAVCGVPHGQCMNIFLPYVLEYHRPMIGEKIGELLLPLAGIDIYTQTPSRKRADRMIEHIIDIKDILYQKTGLARTLSETGQVNESDFQKIADKAFDDGSMVYNVVESDINDILALLTYSYR